MRHYQEMAYATKESYGLHQVRFVCRDTRLSVQEFLSTSKKYLTKLHPSYENTCKSCTGEQSALAVHIYGQLITGGITPFSLLQWEVQSVLLISLPGLQEIASHRHIVPA